MERIHFIGCENSGVMTRRRAFCARTRQAERAGVSGEMSPSSPSFREALPHGL